MNRVAVTSSQIASVGYDDATGTLEIEFKHGGKVYHYANVTKETYSALLAAESPGKFFNAHIKDAHQFHKLGGDHAEGDKAAPATKEAAEGDKAISNTSSGN